MRLGLVFSSLTAIIGGFFSLMGAAYFLGGLVEGLGREKLQISGLSHVVNILILMLVMVMVQPSAPRSKPPRSTSWRKAAARALRTGRRAEGGRPALNMPWASRDVSQLILLIQSLRPS